MDLHDAVKSLNEIGISPDCKDHKLIWTLVNFGYGVFARGYCTSCGMQAFAHPNQEGCEP